MDGTRPKALKLSTVKLIEDFLATAVRLDNSQAHFYYLWALLKYDYYVLNGLRASPPSIDGLLDAAEKGVWSDSEIEQILRHIPVPDSPIKDLLLGDWT